MKIEHIELKYLIRTIPTFLIRKFKKYEFKTVGDVLAIDLEEFREMKGIGLHGQEALTSFQKELRSNPEKFVSAYEEFLSLYNKHQKLAEEKRDFARPQVEPTVIPGSIDPADSALENFRKFEMEYFEQLKSRGGTDFRNYSIMRMTFAIDNEEQSLVRVGTSFGMTRERARQIRNVQLGYLSELLRGRTHRRSFFLRCHEDLVGQIGLIRYELQKKCVIPRQRAYELMRNDAVGRMKTDEEPYLDLILEAFGYDKTEYRRIWVYFKKGRFGATELRKSIAAVIIDLRSRIIPTSERDVLAVMNNRVGSSLFKREDVENILGLVPEISRTTFTRENHYQLRFDKLKLGAMISIVLKEVGHELHYLEIGEIINRKMKECGSEGRDVVAVITVDFDSWKNLQTIANTGKWALTEWGLRHETMKSLMQQILKKAGVPLTYDELYDAVSSVRKPVNRLAMIAAIGISNGAFSRLKNGKVILTEWKKYRNQIRTDIRRSIQYDHEKIMKAIIEIFLENNTRVLNRQFLRKKLVERGFDHSELIVYHNIKRYPILKEVPSGGNFVELKEDYEQHVHVGDMKPMSKTKLKRVEYARRLLGENGGSVRLSDLTKRLSLDLHCSPATVYNLTHEKDLFKTEKRGGFVIVSSLEGDTHSTDEKKEIENADAQ